MRFRYFGSYAISQSLFFYEFSHLFFIQMFFLFLQLFPKLHGIRFPFLKMNHSINCYIKWRRGNGSENVEINIAIRFYINIWFVLIFIATKNCAIKKIYRAYIPETAFLTPCTPTLFFSFFLLSLIIRMAVLILWKKKRKRKLNSRLKLYSNLNACEVTFIFAISSSSSSFFHLPFLISLCVFANTNVRAYR